MSTSTPRKSSSGQVAPNISEGTAHRLQSDLKHDMKEEIANQTFIYPSDKLARMLSPKKLRPGHETPGNLPRLDQYECEVDSQPFLDALDAVVTELKPINPGSDKGESMHYGRLVDFLTRCVETCHKALDNQEAFALRERWYKDLEFTIAKTAADGVEGAAPVRPDVTGGIGISKFAGQRLYWTPPPNEPARRITLPVEVKDDWKDLVAQAATYARCLFGASPMRTFALVLGFDHKNDTLRFLVFHRGGLTASKEYGITKGEGLKEVVRLFLTLASWRTAEEAGAIAYCSDSTYLLPADQEGERHMSATVKALLFRSLCVRGRMTVVSRLQLSTSTPSVVAESSGQELSEPLVELGRSVELRVLRRSTRKKAPTAPVLSGSIPRASGSGGRGPRTRSAPLPAPLPVVLEQMGDAQVQTAPDIQLKTAPDVQAETAPAVQLEYYQPREIIRSEKDPILSKLVGTGTVVLKTSWPPIDRRNNEADMYRASSGRFGTIPHVCSYEAVGKHREAISNILFLPAEDEIGEYHWQIFSTTPPEKPDIRTLRFTVFAAEGKLLVEAKSPREISRAWADSLLGWLSTYLSGHLHRDPSLGNILMMDKPVKREKFEIPQSFYASLSSLAKTNKKEVKKIRDLCTDIKKVVVRLGISDQCTAFITDGDLAISWDNYWTEERRAAKSGTPEFMSRALLKTGEDYLHSPVDDLESCFWVSVWSVFFNKDEANKKHRSDREKRIQDSLDKSDKEGAMLLISMLRVKGEEHSNITRRFQPVLRDWWTKVRHRNEEWMDQVVEKAPGNAGKEYYLPYFHRFALQGVLQALKVLEKYWNGEIGWESWTPPAPSA